jgi:hypothetical protein
MKQTATDWMFDQLWETPKDKLAWHSILIKAKEIEKEQIEKAYYHGKWNDKFKTGLEYYNENYGDK